MTGSGGKKPKSKKLQILYTTGLFEYSVTSVSDSLRNGSAGKVLIIHASSFFKFDSILKMYFRLLFTYSRSWVNGTDR